MSFDQPRILAANHRTRLFDALQDGSKLTIIMMVLYWGLS